MVKFGSTRVATVTGEHNKGLNFGNVETDFYSGVTGDVSSRGDGTRRRRDCWNCGSDHLKSKCPKLG